MLPILFQNNNFILYSYPLLMGLAWGVGYQYFFRHIDNKDRLRAQVFFWGIFISAWIGAKTFFIITSSAHLTSEFINSANFWMGGGFVFYGGLIGGALFALTYHFIWPLPFTWIKSTLVALTLGHGIGRIGCFLAGCCYGDITTAWWGVHLHGQDRHPTQLIEAFFLLSLAYGLKRINSLHGLLGVYTLSYGVLRFGLEFLRADQLRGEWLWGLTPSQWISIFLVIPGVYSLVKKVLRPSK